MKTILSSMVLLAVCAVPLYAEEPVLDPELKRMEAEQARQEERLIVPQSSAARLVSMNTSQNSSEISALERRIDDLERDRRSIDNRLRSMEREIDDLQRRRRY